MKVELLSTDTLASGQYLSRSGDSVVDDSGKIRMSCGLSVARKGQDIGMNALRMHLLELRLETGCNLLTCGTPVLRAEILIETALAVDAVERADLAIRWHEIDSKRDAESAAVDGTEYR